MPSTFVVPSPSLHGRMPFQVWGTFRLNDLRVGQILPGLVWPLLLGVLG